MRAPFSVIVLLLSTAIAAGQKSECDQVRSRQEIQRLMDTGVILSMDRFPPYVTVVVDERRWALSNFEAKNTMAQHVDCATSEANDNMLRTVVFRSNKSNQVLARYSGGELKP